MRKPSPSTARRIVQSALALVVLASCDRASSSSESSVATARREVAAGGVAGSTGGLVQRDEMRRVDAKVLSAPEAPPTAQSAPAVARAALADASSNPGASDVSLGTPIPAVDPTGAMLVRHGQASVEVKTVGDAVARMRQTAARFGGFVANTALVTGKEEQRSATLELRVPSQQFDALVSALDQLGKVESVNVTAEDVSEEYVDLGARLANARRVEARLVEMLATRTGKLSDVLTVEQELARVRQEAERYEARIRWLERRATLSSLDVSLHEKVPLLEPPRGHGPIAEAFAEAWTRCVAFVAWLIASLGILVPVGVLIAVVVVVTRRLLGGGSPPGVPQA